MIEGAADRLAIDAEKASALAKSDTEYQLAGWNQIWSWLTGSEKAKERADEYREQAGKTLDFAYKDTSFEEAVLGNDWVDYSYADKWYNPSRGWQVAGDVAGGIGSSVPMIALGFASGGASLGFSFLGAAGSSMADAYKETGKYNNDVYNYGTLSGLTEAGVEALTMGIGTGTGKIINSLSGVGKGAAQAATSKVAGSFLKSAGKGAWSLTKDAISEGVEEGIASVMSPIYQQLTYNPDAQVNWNDVAYESLIGAISGIFFGGAHGGVSATANTISKASIGSAIYNKGKTDVWVGAAKELIANDTDTNGANTAEVRDALARFENATKKTDGQATSKAQQYLLGALQQSVMRQVVTPTLVEDGINAARNASTIADYYNSLGGKDASGKAFHIDAAEILEGIDQSLLDATDAKSKKLLAKQVEKMLKEGGALARLAVVNAANGIMADTHKTAQGITSGKEQATAQNWNGILDRADANTINELAYKLGGDPRAMSAEQVRAAVDAAMQAEATSPKNKKRLPDKIHDAFSQGAHRYTLPNGRADISIIRNGDLFYLYDHGKTRLMASGIDIDAVNKLLADEAEWNAKKNAEKKEAPQSEADNSERGGLNAESANIAEILRENIKQYSEMNAKDRTTLRRIYRQAIANGMSQQDALACAAVAARSGLNVVIDKARCIGRFKDKDGKEHVKYTNGFYSGERGTIVVNPDAKTDVLLIHELDHALRTKYKNGAMSVSLYADAIKQVPTEKLASIINAYENVDTKLASKEAQYADEANAYYAETALGNMDVLRYLVADRPSLKQRILSFFKKASADYAGVPKLEGYAKKYLKQYKAAFEALAAENRSVSAREDVDDVSEALEARMSGRIGDSQFSLMFADVIADGERVFARDKKSSITSQELDSAIKQTKEMVELMKKHEAILPKDTRGKTLVKNGSYDISVENTTVCIRTLAYNAFTDMVSEKLGRPLTQMESFLVSQKLYDIAKEPQCLYCYVSLDRKAFNDMIIRYTEQRDAALDAYEKAGSPKITRDSALYKDFLNGRKDTQNAWDRYRGWIDIHNNGGKLVTLEDVATEKKRAALSKGSASEQAQIADMLKYAQSASWAKKQTDYVAYFDDILKLSDKVVKDLNGHYGLRWYSFSDYSGAFIVENMQQITDASIRGLKGLAYTKDTDFVKIFAPTGMNINISVYAMKDGKGGYVIDDKQSANIEEAIALREQYPNVGIVVVATDRAGVEWALAQEWSDCVIPFHTVRTGAQVAEFYNWTVFNAEQGDVVQDENLWNAYVDSVAKGKTDKARAKVSKLVYPSEHQNSREEYLRICKERGLKPRFSSFLGNPNYMKLVVETRQSEAQTKALKPVFDVQAAKQAFGKFVDKGGYYEGWYNDGIDVDAEAEIVASDVRSGKKANEVSYGRQDIDTEGIQRGRRRNREHGRRFSLPLDSDYLDAVNRGDMETAQKMVDEAADKAMPGSILREGMAIEKGEEAEGTLVKMFHGSGAKGFNTFETHDGALGKGIYLTSNWDEAVGYAVEKLGVKESADGHSYVWNGEEYDGIGSIGEALESEGYVRSFYANVTNEADVTSSAVYWADVIALVRDSNQLKSADPVTYDDAGNVIPLSERFNPKKSDIRYSLDLNSAVDGRGAEAYSYEALLKKETVSVAALKDVSAEESDRYKKSSVLFGKAMRDIAASYGNPNNTETATYLFCRDLNADVQITRESFKHGAERIDNAYISVCKSVKEILDKSIVVNELSPRDTTNGGYVLLGIAENADNYVIVRSVVNKKTWKLQEYEELAAIKKKSVKKEEAGFKPPHYIQENGYGTSSVFSIADLLENVKSLPLANEVFSMDVLEKLGVTRTKGTLSDSVRYSLPLTPDEQATQEVEQRDVPRKKRAKRSAKERTEAKLKQYFSTERAYEMLHSVYGLKDLSPKSIQGMSNQIWQALNASVSADEKALIAWNTAGYILDRMMTTDLTKANPAAQAAMEELAYLRTGIGRLKFAETDVAELKHAFGKDGMAKIRGRWGYKGNGVAYPMEQFVVDIAREMPGMAYIEEMHPAEAFKVVMEKYDAALETSKEKWISELDGASDIELDSIRNGLAQEILDGFDYLGAESSYSRLESQLENFRVRAERYKLKSELTERRAKEALRLASFAANADIKYEKQRAKAEMILARALGKLREAKVGEFRNATQPDMSDRLRVVFKTLSKIDFRGAPSYATVREQMRALSKWYEDAKTNIIGFKSPEDPGLYNGDIDMKMLEIASKEDSTELGNQEILDLFDIVTYFRRFVENYGKVWYAGNLVDAKETAQGFIDKAKPADIKIKNVAVIQAGDKLKRFRNYVDDIGTVVARADGYREGGFWTSMHDQVREAELAANLARIDAIAEHDAFVDKHKSYLYKAGKELVKFDGKQLTKMHLISLYMTCKREQAWRGIALSGYSYAVPKTDLVQRFQDGLLDKDATDAEIAQFVADKRAAIEKLLTKEDMEYIRILEKAYNGTLRDMKVKRDYERQGYSNVADGYYYPIRRGAMPKTAERMMQEAYNSFNNSAFNKNTVEHAAQELVIDNAEALFQRHVRAVSNYAHVGGVVDAFNVLFNLDVSDNSNRPTSIQTVTQNAWSKGHEYFVNLFSDIKGTRMQSELNQFLGAIRGKSAVAALGANFKVLATQFSSLIASTSIIDPQNFFLAIKGGTSNAKDVAGLKEVDRYCDLARFRRADNSAARAQGGIDGTLSNLGEFLMGGIGAMDRAVILIEWRACQVQVARQMGEGFELGSEANKVEAGKLLTKVIQDTQQNSLKSERTAAMRSPEQIMKAATMFTADQVKVFGRVIQSWGTVIELQKQINAATDAQEKASLVKMRKQAHKKMTRATVALAGQSIYMALVTLLFNSFYGRRDDDDDSWVEEVGHDFITGMFSGIPFVKDIMSFAFEGYEISDMSFDAVNNVLNSCKNIYSLLNKEDRTTQDIANGIKTITFSLSQMLGIPVRNIYNTSYGILNVAGKWGSDTAVGWRWEVDKFFRKTSLESDLKKALERDDDVQIDYILDLIGKERFGATFTATTRNELRRLAKSGYTALPKSIGDTVKINGVEYKLTTEQQTAISKYYREALPSLNTLVESKAYSDLSIVDKEKAIEQLMSVTYDDALCRALDLEEDNGVLTSRVVGASTYALYRVNTSRIDSTVVNGVTVSGSKRRKVVAAINAMDISDVQKVLLLYKSGYSVADGDIGKMTAQAARARLAIYLNTYGGDAYEKEGLAKMCKMSLKNGKFVAKSE
jgi:hypothetical protein